MYKDKRGVIYTDIIKIGKNLACKLGRVHPSFTSYGHPFTYKGSIYIKVVKKEGNHG